MTFAYHFNYPSHSHMIGICSTVFNVRVSAIAVLCISLPALILFFSTFPPPYNSYNHKIVTASKESIFKLSNSCYNIESLISVFVVPNPTASLHQDSNHILCQKVFPHITPENLFHFIWCLFSIPLTMGTVSHYPLCPDPSSFYIPFNPFTAITFFVRSPSFPNISQYL